MFDCSPELSRRIVSLKRSAMSLCSINRILARLTSAGSPAGSDSLSAFASMSIGTDPLRTSDKPGRLGGQMGGAGNEHLKRIVRRHDSAPWQKLDLLPPESVALLGFYRGHRE